MSCEKPLAILPDIDGSLKVAPTCLVSAIRASHERGRAPTHLPFPISSIVDSMQTVFFKHQPSKKDSLKGLEEFKRLGDEFEREVEVAVMSARSSSHLEATKEGMRRSGHLEHIDRFHLNGFSDLFGWRNEIVQSYLERDFSVIVIEDDTVTAKKLAAENQEGVVVYTFRNLTNLCIKQKNVPENLIFIRSMVDATKDTSRRLSLGEL
jgi:hypothetical protein